MLDVRTVPALVDDGRHTDGVMAAAWPATLAATVRIHGAALPPSCFDNTVITVQHSLCIAPVVRLYVNLFVSIYF